MRIPSACHCAICSKVTRSRTSGTTFKNSGAAGAATAAMLSVISSRRSRLSDGTLLTVFAPSRSTPAASFPPVITRRLAREISGARCVVAISTSPAVAASKSTVVSRQDFSATTLTRLIN